MKSILVSNYKNLGENVMLFTKNLSVFYVSSFFKIIQHSFDDVVEVNTNDLEYYVYDALWTDDQMEQNVLKEVNKFFLSSN